MARKYRRTKRRKSMKRRRSRKKRAGLAPPPAMPGLQTNEDCSAELSDQKFAGCGTMRSWEKDEMCEPLDCQDYPAQREAYIKKHSSGKVKLTKAKGKNVSALAAKFGKLNFGGPRPMGKRGPMPALPMPPLPPPGKKGPIGLPPPLPGQKRKTGDASSKLTKKEMPIEEPLPKRTTTEVPHCSGPGDCSSKRAQESSGMCLSFGYNKKTGKSNCKWCGPTSKKHTKKSSHHKHDHHKTKKRKTGDASSKLTKKAMPIEQPLPKPVPQLKKGPTAEELYQKAIKLGPVKGFKACRYDLFPNNKTDAEEKKKMYECMKRVNASKEEWYANLKKNHVNKSAPGYKPPGASPPAAKVRLSREEKKAMEKEKAKKMFTYLGPDRQRRLKKKGKQNKLIAVEGRFHSVLEQFQKKGDQYAEDGKYCSGLKTPKEVFRGHTKCVQNYKKMHAKNDPKGLLKGGYRKGKKSRKSRKKKRKKKKKSRKRRR